MFFGDFAEKNKEEIEIKDVVYEEFFDLLRLLYFDTMEITDHTVPHILKLADQYQIEKLLDQSKKYITQSEGFDVMKKLLLADRYNIAFLKDQCLMSFTRAKDLSKMLKSSPDYDIFSDGMKVAICDRIRQLKQQ
ncbi:hypothetical protein PMAYCL1PPCAC_25620 [Pristionchus mayeri]|uniref:BTB domain-containing protein n=1 Tax=Pristionchus mayeri TaxID=1317129 RepID=A0AAN5I8X2_9BILA|nr:hypothetical protein PMAYCL1PPCAC_25620 [Pristionchus mayeri]